VKLKKREIAWYQVNSYMLWTKIMPTINCSGAVKGKQRAARRRFGFTRPQTNTLVLTPTTPVSIHPSMT
jgi:hypothetical protein